MPRPRRFLLSNQSRAFAPTDIPGLALWLDASDAATITLDGSNNVSQWNDKSGNGRNFTQGTALQRPSRTLAGQNGLNVVTFDGADDNLSSSLGVLSLSDVSCFVVASTNFGGSTGRTLISCPQANGSHTDPFFRWSIFAGNTGTFDSRWNGVAGVTASVVLANSAQIIGIDTVAGKYYVNGTEVYSRTPTTITYPNSVPCVIGRNGGGSESWRGFVAEVIVYGKGLSAPERSSVESYLRSKWGTP